MAPSPDYKLIGSKEWPALFYPYISEAAWLDCQHRPSDTFGDPD